jgi:hypothetical protein
MKPGMGRKSEKRALVCGGSSKLPVEVRKTRSGAVGYYQDKKISKYRARSTDALGAW